MSRLNESVHAGDQKDDVYLFASRGEPIGSFLLLYFIGVFYNVFLTPFFRENLEIERWKMYLMV